MGSNVFVCGYQMMIEKKQKEYLIFKNELTLQKKCG